MSLEWFFSLAIFKGGGNPFGSLTFLRIQNPRWNLKKEKLGTTI
jgi:hypothetical protein